MDQNHYVPPNINNWHINSCTITNEVAVSAQAKRADTLTLFYLISVVFYLILCGKEGKNLTVLPVSTHVEITLFRGSLRGKGNCYLPEKPLTF
jgi:hypothetical protein